MASFNKVILIGNHTADPELRQTTSGKSVCNFTIAVNRPRADAEKGQQTVDFINAVAWGTTAEFISKYFKKGNPILICGQLQSGSYTDSLGEKKYFTEVLTDEVSFVAPSSSNKSDNAK